MRDRGFDFQWYDKYTQNLFARGFEKSRGHYDVVTAFELFEHYDKPLDEIKKLAELGDEIIFSTLLLPEPAPKPDDWWYYSTSTGQHISFYTKRALIHCAELIGPYYVGRVKGYISFQDDRFLTGNFAYVSADSVDILCEIDEEVCWQRTMRS